jgi:nucleoid-associated protein YgaU
VVPPKPQPKEVAKVEKAVQSEPEVKKEITIVPTPAEKEIAAIIEKTAQPEREVAEEIAAVTPPADEIAAIIEKAAQPEAEVAEKSAAVTPPADKIAAIIEKTTVEKSPITEVPVQEEPRVETKPVAPEPEPDEKIAKIVSPAMKEKREVMPGDTFLVMIQKVYGPGHLKPHFINQVIAANPQLRDHDNLAIGDEVFFPVLTARDEMPVAIAMEEKAVAAVKKTGSLVSKKLDRELQPADSPDLIGKLTVQPGDTLGKLIRGVYGPFSFKPDYTSKVLAVNKQLKNPDRLEVGETIYFPDLPIIPEIGLPAKPQSVSSRGDMPEFLGEIIAIEEETFGDMIRKIYGPYSFNDENVAKVLAVNPGLKSPELLSVGQKILFPTILVALTPEAPDVWWVKIINLDNLQSAYRFLRVYSKWSPPMLIIPSRDNAGRVLFNVVLQKHFMDEQSAQKTISELPNSITIDAKVLHGLDSNTFYYWTKQKD